MDKPFTPKQVAIAIGVSESSVKRWCDKGKIDTRYTVGGHRRISTGGLLTFLKKSKHDLVNPRAIGFPERLPLDSLAPEDILNRIVEPLTEGRESQVRQIAIELFLAEVSIARICDEFLAPAFVKIGEMWECSQVEVYQERRACQMAVRILHEFRALLSTPEPEAPVAIGAAPSGDYYTLPTMMVELVMRDHRWNATSMGENVPLASLATAIARHMPKIFWLSVSHLESTERFIAEYQQLHSQFSDRVQFVLGGQALTEEVTSRISYTLHCKNLQQLESFVASRIVNKPR